MTNYQANFFPTLGEIMTLVRSIVNDTFTGIGGVQGRIIPNDAAVVLPFLNDAVSTVSRKLRNEGCTFPIVDGFVLYNVPPVVVANPDVFVSIGQNGTYNGTTTSLTPALPSDCYQVYKVQQRVNGSNLPFTPMAQADQGLPSAYQNNWMGAWEFRRYQIFLNGSLQAQDLMIRYLQLQTPINTPAADFDSTPIYIADSTSALANLIAAKYGNRLGASGEQINMCKADAAEAIDDMALEYIRRGQTVTYRREAYQGGGSNSTGNTSVGSTGTTS